MNTESPPKCPRCGSTEVLANGIGYYCQYCPINLMSPGRWRSSHIHHGPLLTPRWRREVSSPNPIMLSRESLDALKVKWNLKDFRFKAIPLCGIWSMGFLAGAVFLQSPVVMIVSAVLGLTMFVLITIDIICW